MENLFYHIGADLSKFPFLMYQIGTLESIRIRGGMRKGELQIFRTPSVGAGNNVFCYSITDIATNFNKNSFKLTQIDYIVLLYSACEVLSKIEKVKSEYTKLNTEYLEKRAVIDNLFKNYNKSFKYDSILGYEYIKLPWKWKSNIPGDRIPALLDITSFEKDEVENSFNVFGDYNILPKTIFGQISSDESKHKTMFYFVGMLRRNDLADKPTLKLFEYFLPNDIKPENFKNEIEFEKNNYILLLHVTYTLSEWCKVIEHNNSCFQKEIESFDYEIGRESASFVQYSDDLKKYLIALEQEIDRQKNIVSEYAKKAQDKFNELHNAFYKKSEDYLNLIELHKNEIKALKESHQEVVDKLNKEFAKVKEQMLAQNNDVPNKEISFMKDDYEQQLSNLREKFELEINTLKDLHHKVTDELINDCKKLEERISTLCLENETLVYKNEQIRSEITNKIVAEKILENTTYSTNDNEWNRKFFDELSSRLKEISQTEELLAKRQLLTETEKWANEIKLNIELNKSENEKHLLEMNKAKIELKVEQFEMQAELLKEGLSRKDEDFKVQKLLFENKVENEDIKNKLHLEELNREKHLFEIEQKLKKDELDRASQQIKNEETELNVKKTKDFLESKLKEEELNRAKQDNKIEKAMIDLDRKQMQIDFISLRNELNSESLSMKEFAMQKTNEYQKFEIAAKENLLKMGETINLQDSKNLQAERIKLEIADKLAEMGIQVREQNVQIQKQMNDIEQKNIRNEKQLLEMNRGKLEAQNTLAQAKVDFQKNQNDLTEMILKIKDGEFRNNASALILELNKKYLENDIQLQSMGLIQRENENLLRERETDIKQLLLQNQSVVNNLKLLQQQNNLQTKMEEERQSNYNQEQNLQARIWSLQNSLERSQIELSGERALKKYLQQ